MCNDAVIFWWPDMRADIEKEAKTCSACLNAGKNLKTQLPSTEESKLEPPKHPGEEIQIDFTGNLNSIHLDSSFIIVVEKNSRWPVAKICKNPNHDTVITFLQEYLNVYGVPKTIKLDNDSSFISKENKNFCKEYNIICKYGQPSVHTGNIPILEKPDKDKFRRKTKLTRKHKQSILYTPFCYTFRSKENPL